MQAKTKHRFGDPLERKCSMIASDLNDKILLPEYAQKVYGAVIAQDKEGVWSVDENKTQERRAEIRKERIARSKPTKEWMKEEREKILKKEASAPVQHMFATSFGLSEKFLKEFKTFWELPDSWELKETELGVHSYGSVFRMDLSKMPDVKTVVLVEE